MLAIQLLTSPTARVPVLRNRYGKVPRSRCAVHICEKTELRTFHRALPGACAAGGNFRLVTKVTKGTPRKEENRSVRFSSPLGTPHLSTDRGSPPRCKRAGAYRYDNTDVMPALGNARRNSRAGQRPEECSRFAPKALMFSIASRKFPAALTLQFKYPNVAGTTFSSSIT